MKKQSTALTIEELAERTGVSVRNIRYYQTRGLIPRPRLEGRTGYYETRHIERLALIDELQQEGMNLRAIGFLLGGAESVASDELRNLKRAVLDGWMGEGPEELTRAELVERLRLEEVDAALEDRAVQLGLFEPIEEGDKLRTEVPAVLRAGGVLHDLGVAPHRTLDVLELLHGQTRPIATAFIELFDEAVLARFDARGRPAEEWPEVRAAVERLRSIAGEALLAVFQQAMSEAVAEYLQEIGPEA